MPCALSSINCAGQPWVKPGHDNGIGKNIRVMKSRKGKAFVTSALLFVIPARALLGRDDDLGQAPYTLLSRAKGGALCAPSHVIIDKSELIAGPLTVNIVAVVIQLVVQLLLLGLGDVTAMLCLVPLELPLHASIACIIVSRLLAGKLFVAEALIDAVFLIIDPALNFIHPGMAGVCRFLREDRA